jgi:hypothetical protein
MFDIQVSNFVFDLPSNTSSRPGITDDLKRQVGKARAASTSLARRCLTKTGHALEFMGTTPLLLGWVPYVCAESSCVGTEAVVKDLDYMSKIIEGEDKPINCRSALLMPKLAPLT